MNRVDLSIIMLAYNVQDFIQAAVDSLLNQTFRQFELIIIDDGSTDQTPQLMKDFLDPRICCRYNERNRGIVYCRNAGLDMAQGEFISFFDSDDLAHPAKYQKQIDFLRKNPVLGFAGTSVILIDEKDREIGKWPMHFGRKRLLPRMIFHNCFVNSSVVFRQEKLHGFRFPEGLDMVEDYVLWWKMLNSGAGCIMQEYLTLYRRHTGSIIIRNAEVINRINLRVFQIILNDIGIEPSTEDLAIHLALKGADRVTSFSEIKQYRSWLLRIASATAGNPLFDRWALFSVLLNRWMKVVYKARGNLFLLMAALFLTGFCFRLKTILFLTKQSVR